MLRLDTQEAVLGVVITWILAPLGGAFVGFYLGTIWATPSQLDLRARDVNLGLVTGGIGLLLGILYALGVTLIYPAYVNRDFAPHDHPAEH
jgi:hypothetical protein